MPGRGKGIHLKMSEVNDSQYTYFGMPRPRVTQRSLQPTAVKPSALSQTTIVNTQATINGPFSLNNGSSLSIRSIIANNTNPDFRLGGVPYCITFFQTSLATSTIIGDAVTGGYTINGPMPMAQFSPYATSSSAGGNDGNNLVFLTELINNTGGTKNIYYITNTRVYVPLGGGPT